MRADLKIANTIDTPLKISYLISLNEIPNRFN